jgi:hypothetical protein
MDQVPAEPGVWGQAWVLLAPLLVSLLARPDSELDCLVKTVSLTVSELDQTVSLTVSELDQTVSSLLARPNSELDGSELPLTHCSQSSLFSLTVHSVTVHSVTVHSVTVHSVTVHSVTVQAQPGVWVHVW